MPCITQPLMLLSEHLMNSFEHRNQLYVLQRPAFGHLDVFSQASGIMRTVRGTTTHTVGGNHGD
jgi:hypothetical protein